MSRAVEEYLKPDVVQQIARLDLRAKFIVKGFLQGLHASPFQGFSVEFSEHRRYAAGDDPKDIDWLVYAKTDKHYIKKYEFKTRNTSSKTCQTDGMAGGERRDLVLNNMGGGAAVAQRWKYFHTNAKVLSPHCH